MEKIEKEKISLASVANDVARTKTMHHTNEVKLKLNILEEWFRVIDGAHIRQCVTRAQSRNKTYCVLFTQEKSALLTSSDYERLLRRTKVPQNQEKTMEQTILDYLEEGQFCVKSGMIGIENYGNLFEGYSFTETDFEIRLEWGPFRHCTVQ